MDSFQEFSAFSGISEDIRHDHKQEED